MQAAIHIPVLLEQTIGLLSPKTGGRYLDGTVGLGGHAGAILDAGSGIELCGLDRDTRALAIARERLARHGDRVHLFHQCFSSFETALQSLGWASLDGALVDIGVSSLQLDDGARGFSFREDAPLDMRMDANSTDRTAADIVNGEPLAWLREKIALYGEEPCAERIARQIVRAREQKPIATTGELAAIVEAAYPARWRKNARNHPATRTFQALRIMVNRELDELEKFLRQIVSYLRPGGRLLVISFHSLEDRMVKQAMKKYSGAGYGAIRDMAPSKPVARLLCKKPLVADAAELAKNPRAASAKLRALEKIAE